MKRQAIAIFFLFCQLVTYFIWVFGSMEKRTKDGEERNKGFPAGDNRYNYTECNNNCPDALGELAKCIKNGLESIIQLLLLLSCMIFWLLK